jgi:hypothetical protein
MPIDGGLRNKLGEGTTLVAKYKGTEYRARVVVGADGKMLFRLEDGREFKSPSSAGSAVMNGMACNGWRFWSVDDGSATVAKPRAGKPPAAKPAKQPAAKQAATKASAKSERPRCKRCGKTFVSAQQLAHHEANADRLCHPA